MNRPLSRSTYSKLKSALRHLSPDPEQVYIDKQGGHGFSITRKRISRPWMITRISAVDSLASDFNLGEQIGSLPTATYALGRGGLYRNDSPTLVSPGEGNGVPEIIDIDRPRIGLRTVMFERRLGSLDVPENEALELAEQLHRAVPARDADV